MCGTIIAQRRVLSKPIVQFSVDAKGAAPCCSQRWSEGRELQRGSLCKFVDLGSSSAEVTEREVRGRPFGD